MRPRLPDYNSSVSYYSITKYRTTEFRAAMLLLAVLLLMLAPLLTQSFPGQTWLYFIPAPILLLGWVLNHAHSRRRARRLEVELFRLMNPDVCSACGYTKGYAQYRCSECGKAVSDANQACANRIMRFVDGAPASRVEAALPDEQIDAAMRHATSKNHSVVEKFFLLMGRCYICVVCIVPFVLVTAVAFFPRRLAAICGAIGVCLVIVAFLYRHNDNPEIDKPRGMR